ncbi:ankyrin repeat-containing domain protein [Morchella snyderi]|nr:ankyrin repeat-containing domain protein [Morchella snyderi]
MVQALLDAGADLTVPPRNHSGSYTWLHAAAELGNVALFKSALDAGVDPHARGDNNESPLHSAAYSGSVDIVSLLVDRGLSVNLRDKQDQTPLHYAWGAATIALLLERGACTSSTDTSGNSPLHSQLHKDSDGWPGRITSEAVRLLIRAGVDVNARNRSGATPLHFAARMGYAVPVSLLLKSGADIAALDVNQASAMHYAAMSGNCQDAVSVLVEWGLSIDARDEDQKTPLHHAALNEQILAHRIVELLVEKGASVGLRDSDGFTPLRYLVDRCLEYTTPHKVRTLIQAGADVNTVDDGGVSLLHLATQQCDEEMLALLLDAGADIHARDSSQRTPLHYSTHEINYTCEEKLRLLVKRGAHINAKDINGSTPLQYLLDRHYFMSPPHHAIQTMISLGADINVVSHHLQRSPLHLAAEGGSVQLLALLLDAGVDINVRESSQKTPLHYAVLAFFVRHPKIIIYLAGKGANMNARDTNGNTPMHSLMGVSRFMRGLDIAAQTLIFLGADVNAYRDDRKGPLHLAAESNSKELVAVLLDARADIHACDSKQRTPLHHAVLAKNDLKVIRYLADRGANVNARDIDGNTPLRILLGYAQLSWQVTDVAKVLLSFGADVNTVNDSDQNSPLHLAAKHGSKKLLVLLLHAGADRHACNCDQKTPLDIAITHRRSADITEMLVDRSNEHCPGMRVETDDATCDNDAPGQYPEDEPTRKRRYSIVTSIFV